jgi:hypothetical protein
VTDTTVITLAQPGTFTDSLTEIFMQRGVCPSDAGRRDGSR